MVPSHNLCDKRCTNQLGKITINVKLLAVLNNRYMYIVLKLYIAITDTVQCSRSYNNEDYRIKNKNKKHNNICKMSKLCINKT